MSVASPRFVSLVGALALAVSGSIAQAQVTVHLTTTQQANCDATTDANGLSLVPGGTDLRATGVTLTGAGCGGGSFGAAVTAPGTATVGTPVNITWSAGEAATVCTYGTPSSGVTGWPTGTAACQGTACAGSHVVPVTINTAGTYNFGITCTNSTGFAQAAVVANVSNLPPAPDNFPLVVSASPVTGTPFTVNWAVTGATTCTGAASLNGSSVNLTGWTTSTSATPPRSVTATTAGTYTLSLTCSNTVGSVTSQPATVVVAQGSGDVCPSTPRTRATVSDINYQPGTHIRHNVDLTQWSEIWGHLNETDQSTPWPGNAGSTPTIKTLGKTQYVAAKFHVGSVPSTLSGFYKNVSYYAGPNLDMSISQTCGDFTPAQAGCIKTDIPASDGGIVYWRMVNPSNFYCQLTPNTDYYLNVQFHDPATTGPGCNGATCQTSIQHNHN